MVDFKLESIALKDHGMRWLLEIEEGKEPTEEHKDQISALSPKSSKYLWNLKESIGIDNFHYELDDYFTDVRDFELFENMESELKKWLFNLGIPFSREVYFSIDPKTCFILTWKMIIKYSTNLFFAYDLVVFDKTQNWTLIYDHNDKFKFGQNRIC